MQKIQRTGARFVLNKRWRRSADLESATQMVHDLNWDTLQERRRRTKLIFLYKTIHGLVAVPPSYHPTPTSNIHNTRNLPEGSLQIYQPSVNALKYSLIPRTVTEWNTLPQEVTQLATLDAFTASLVRINQIYYFIVVNSAKL